MNKREMVERIVERTDFPLTVVAEIVDTFIDETSAAVIAGDRVTLSGFGTFYRQARAQRTARNIWTGEAVTVRARELPAFRPGKPFRDEVARRRRKPQNSSGKRRPSQCWAAAKRPDARVRNSSVKPHRRRPAAAIAVSCGHTEPLW